MEFKDLTPEQQERVKACKTPEELIEFVQESGEDLTEEELTAISGGSWESDYRPNYTDCDDFGSDDMC